MIIEHVHLNIHDGKSEAFELAFQQAKEVIAPMKGLNAVQLIKHIENEHAYILLVFWDHLEDHNVGFRSSNAYQKWMELLHPFFNPVPKVDYYKPCQLMKIK